MTDALTEQDVLFPPGESEGAYFLPKSELSKRYTAQQAREIEGKRELVCMCLAAGWPLDVIAQRGGMNYRTVVALCAQQSEKVAGNFKEFAGVLRTLGARWYGLARAKEGEASFIQLAQAASFAVQRSNECMAVAQMGEVGGEDSSITVEADPQSAVARVRELLGSRSKFDERTTNEQLQHIDKQGASNGDAADDAVLSTGDRPGDPVENIEADGEGGGSPDPASGGNPMYPAARGILGKGSPPLGNVP